MWYLLVFVAVGAAAAVALAFWVFSTFRKLKDLRKAADDAWVALESRLADRHGFLASAAETLDIAGLEEIRAAAVATQGVASRAKAEQRLTSLLANYEDESADLAGASREIHSARQHYNESVMSYNDAVQSGLGPAAAQVFGFKTATFFEQQDRSSREIRRPSE